MSAPAAMAHDAMCEEIERCHATDELEREIARLPLVEQLKAWHRIASNLEPERMACEVRMRAERAYTLLLRDAAGYPPKNRRDARWLAGFQSGRVDRAEIEPNMAASGG